MRNICFAIIAGALTMALGVLAPSAATAQETFFVAPSGRVGIGTTDPTHLVDVRWDAAGNAIQRVQNKNAAGFSGIEYYDHNGNAGAFFGLDNAGSNTRLNSFSNKPLIIFTNSVERMRVTSDGKVGIGTGNPAAPLHVRRTDGTAMIQVTETSGTGASRTLFNLENNGQVKLRMKDTAQTPEWLVTASNAFQIDNLADVGVELQVNPDGALIVNGAQMNVPDYVFEPGYSLMPLDELQAFIAREKHLPNVPSAREVKEQGLNLSQFQMRLLEKIEELTLHAIAQGKEIERLRSALGIPVSGTQQ